MKMNSHSRRRLVMVLAAVVLLLVGRITLATHPFEHDFLEQPLDCEICEHIHVVSDANLQDCHRSAVAIEEVAISLLQHSLGAEKNWRSALARAPPVTSSGSFSIRAH